MRKRWYDGLSAVVAVSAVAVRSGALVQMLCCSKVPSAFDTCIIAKTISILFFVKF